jgi:DNA invertase Pin-like site-specific DNA recombinase
MAVMGCPEKGAPERRGGLCDLKGLGGSRSVSEKESLAGQKRAAVRPRPGTRTALYLRVSTAGQKPDLQHDGLHGYAARTGLDVVRSYCDVAVSGRREGRPQLTALMAAARQREIDCVLVWKFDRFARSARHLLAALEEFDHLGVRLVSVQDQVDTASPMGRAMFTIIGAMAELESSLISERVTAGMRAAAARGKHLGRPPTPQPVVGEIETLARSTDLSIRGIQKRIAGRASRSIVGEITKRARAAKPAAL